MTTRRTLFPALLVAASCAAPLHAATHVYVVHGFGSSRLTMRRMCEFLRDSGYTVHNYGYRSLSRSIPDVSRDLYEHVGKHAPGDTVHFVTHSMGGLIARGLLRHARQDSSGPSIHRIVMLTPPNKGAQLADFFTKWDIVKWFVGPNVDLMTTDSLSYATALPVPDEEEYGVIAGARFDGKRKGYNPFISGDDDGFMTVDRTRLGVEDDFMVLPYGHVMMIGRREVMNNVLSFLRDGRFMAASTAEDSTSAGANGAAE